MPDTVPGTKNTTARDPGIHTDNHLTQEDQRPKVSSVAMCTHAKAQRDDFRGTAFTMMIVLLLGSGLFRFQENQYE